MLFLVLTSANETECQNRLFNNFVPLFRFSVKFVALEAYEVGLVVKGPSTILSLCSLFVWVGGVYAENNLCHAS